MTCFFEYSQKVNFLKAKIYFAAAVLPQKLFTKNKKCDIISSIENTREERKYERTYQPLC